MSEVYTTAFIVGFLKEAAQYKTLLKEFVKKNPNKSIAAAGLVGYGAGHMLTSKRDLEDLETEFDET